MREQLNFKNRKMKDVKEKTNLSKEDLIAKLEESNKKNIEEGTREVEEILKNRNLDITFSLEFFSTGGALPKIMLINKQK